MHVDIMRGLPGSGKSFWAKVRMSQAKGVGVIVSADNYFMRDGVYTFNPSRITEAHDDCLGRFIKAVDKGNDYITVDNTNIHAWEIAPYYRLAEHYGYSVQVVQVNTPLTTCMKRQTHGVPELTMGMMYANLQREVLPKYWKVYQIDGVLK